jgi:hypothetical protein
MPEQTTARVTREPREAIRRLIAIALSDTGQSRRVADFLLAWHNGGANGQSWSTFDTAFTLREKLQQLQGRPLDSLFPIRAN